MHGGKLIIVFGPSGSGKRELIQHIRKSVPSVRFPLSYTTREQRSSAENESYCFISVEEFQNRVAKKEFLEWAEYAGNFYGTGLQEIQDGIEKGSVLIKEIEVQGIEQALKKLPRENVVLVFVDAGSWETLERRARTRGSITEEALAKRHLRYKEEMGFVERTLPDVRIYNPDGELDKAKETFEALVRAMIKNTVG